MRRVAWVLAAVVLAVCARPSTGQSAVARGGKLVWDWGKKVSEDLYKREGQINDIKKDFDTLSDEDRQADGEYPPGPEVPSDCIEKPEECADCQFEKALGDLQKVRYALEKLRRVYAGTKNLVTHSLAVGDAMASSAGVGGLAWVGERRKILASFAEVKVSYDAKYEELMAKLEAALRQIAECEERVYGEKRWYDRWGFMYYEFMAARYQRAD